MARILYAEDNVDNALWIQRRLERLNHVVRIAENGADAVSLARHEPPDLILMDLHMPIMSGLDATRLIKAIPALSRVPVLAVTADTNLRAEAFAAGCDEFVLKPVDFKALTRLIDNILQRRAP
jgi:CheY-like chemotaxis protein